MDKHVPHAYTFPSPRRPIFWLRVSETRKSLFCPCGFEAKMSDGYSALGSLACHLNPETPRGFLPPSCAERFPDHYLLQFGNTGPLFKLTRVDGKTIDEHHVKKVFRIKNCDTVDEALQLYLLDQPYQQIFSDWTLTEDSRKRRHKVATERAFDAGLLGTMDFQDLLFDTGYPGPRNITVEDVVKHVFDDEAKVTLGLRVETLQRCWNATSQAIRAVSGEGRLQHIVHMLEEERAAWSMELSVKRKLLDMTARATMLHGVLDEFANRCVYDSD